MVDVWVRVLGEVDEEVDELRFEGESVRGGCWGGGEGGG
jgi:hypothetical protein